MRDIPVIRAVVGVAVSGLAVAASAQPFLRYIGTADSEDSARAITRTADGGFAFYHQVSDMDTFTADPELVRTDVAGNVLWATRLSEVDSNGASAVLELPAAFGGGFIVAGDSISFDESPLQIRIARISDTGALVWSREIAGGPSFVGPALAWLSDGTIGSGDAGPSFSGRQLAHLAKIATSNAVIFNREYSLFPAADFETLVVADVQADGAGGMIAVGTAFTSDLVVSRADIFVLRVDATGAPLDATVLSGPSLEDGSDAYEEARAIVALPGGGYHIAAYSDLGVQFGSFSPLHVRLDADLDVVTAVGHTGGFNTVEPAFSGMTLDGEGLIAVAGNAPFGDGGNTGRLWRVDANGQLIWHRELFDPIIGANTFAGDVVATDAPAGGPQFTVIGNLRTFGFDNAPFGNAEAMLTRVPNEFSGDSCNISEVFLEVIPQTIIAGPIAVIEFVDLDGNDAWLVDPVAPAIGSFDPCGSGPCPADFNGDTVPGDIFDLFDFLAALDGGLDFNGDTSPADIFDLFDFLAVLDAGCP